MSNIQSAGGVAAVPNRSATQSHDNAVRVSQEDLVAALCDKLGHNLVAVLVDRDKSTISRWKTGKVAPGEAALRPLRVAYQIFQMLENVEADVTIRAWFMGMNPQLEDVSPLEALREGRNREALAAARAFTTGG